MFSIKIGAEIDGMGLFISKAKKYNNEKGFSLVELIVIIAIMVVLIGAASIGFGLVSTKSATQCARNIKISLEKNRLNTLGKKNGYVGFYKGADGIYMIEKFDYSESPQISLYDSSTKIGKSDVTVSYGPSSDSLTPLDGDGVIVEFKRSDGSLKSGSDIVFVVSKNSRTYTITVDSLTGRVVLK